MNIKQAEHLTGVSRQNIRFYEKQGLLTPSRNPGNDYRDYSPQDIETLKWIRAMRMLDMPLEDVGQVLQGAVGLPQAAAAQQQRLEQQVEKLEAAIRLCGVLSQRSGLEAVSVDECLSQMEAEPVGYFQQWKLDYLAVAQAEHRRVFTFTPEEAVTTPREFTDALLAMARKEDLDLVITRESMYPLFTIDGIEYTAYRDYHRMGMRGFSVPVATVHCEMTHPEDHLPPVPERRRKAISILRSLWPGFAVLAYIFITRRGLFDGSWQGLVVLGVLVIVAAMGCYWNWRFHFNEKGT